MLIVGATNTGKTSLSFRTAYEEAERGGCPLFICNKAKIEAKLPLDVRPGTEGVEQSRMSPEVLSRINMKYVTSMNELKAVISGMHCFTPLPSTIIIDDFSLLIDPLHSVPRSDPKFLDICLSIGAYIDDVLNFLAGKSTPPVAIPNSIPNSTSSASSGSNLQLLITDTCDEVTFLHILQKYIYHAAKLVKTNNGEYYSLVSVADVRMRGNNNRGVLLSRIEISQGALYVRDS